MARIDQYPLIPVPGPNTELPYNDPSDTTQGGNGSVKRVYADQLPMLSGGVLSGTGWTKLHVAIAAGGRVDVPVIGDSITEGWGAAAFASRWIAQANNALRAAFPTAGNGSGGGLGFIPVQGTGEPSYTWPVSVTGTPGVLDLGPTRNCSNTAAATSWTFTAPTGTTSVRVAYYDASAAGSFTYKVNSGSTTTVSNASTDADLLTSSIPMNSGDVLTIAWVSGTIFIDGLVHYAGDESAGITLHGCGHSGYTAADWAAPETFSLNWYQALNMFSPVAFGVMLGANDANVTGGNRTASQFASDLTTLIAGVRANCSSLATAPVLILAYYQGDFTTADPGGWPAYVAAMRSVSQADPVGAHVIDMSYAMPTVASGFDGGALYYDSVHPNSTGHAMLGWGIATGITGGMRAGAPANSGMFTGTLATKHNTLDDGFGDTVITGDMFIDNAGGKGSFSVIGAGDGSQYSNFNMADNVFPLDAAGHYWAFSHREGSSTDHQLWIFNYNGAGVYKNILLLTETGGVSTAGNTLDDGSGNVTLAGNLKLAAGTTSLAPAKFQSGSLLTAAAAGAHEYDGVSTYVTNDTTSGRGLVPVEQRFRLTATGSTISTIANYFGTNSNISLVSGAEYEIEIDAWFLKTTAGIVTWTFTNSAAPTSMTIDSQFSPAGGLVTGTPTATELFGQQYNVTATAPTVASASLTTAVNHRHRFKIRLINGTGTSLKIQATAGTGSITPGINSYWKARRVPAANVGTFAA